MIYDFSLTEAKQFASEGNLEEWVHLFLNDIGNNSTLSDGLQLQKRYWIGPLLINIDLLSRCCGPEPSMQYYNSPDSWNERVTRLKNLIQDNWDMPPLIVEHTSDKLWVRDGNGRLEAMRRSGIVETWVVIWDNDSMTNITHYLNK